MLRLLTILLLLTLSFSGYCQTFTAVIKPAGTNSETQDITIAGHTFEGGYSRSGSIWIVRISGNTGEPYKAYLGTRTEIDFTDANGVAHKVWHTKKKDKYWYFIYEDEKLKKKYLEIEE